MSQRLYLGVDIGTYETKGVLVKQDGKIISIASRKHKMIVPQKGWAEHRPNEDWWGDFVYVCKKLITKSKQWVGITTGFNRDIIRFKIFLVAITPFCL